MTIAEWIARNLATATPLGGGCLLCPEFNFHRNCCSAAIFIKTLQFAHQRGRHVRLPSRLRRLQSR